MFVTSSSVRPSVWEWLQVALLGMNLTWTTLCLGGYLSETMVVTTALNGLLLLVHGLARFMGAAGRSHPAGWCLLPFLAYALANVLWITPVRWLGWHDWLEWVQLILFFWVVLNGVRAPAARTTLLMILMGLGVLAVAMECYQQFVRPYWLMLGRIQADQYIGRSSGPFGIPNNMAAFLVLLLPVTIALAIRRGAGGLQRLGFGSCVIWFAIGLVLTLSRGAWLGLALALAAWPLFAPGRHWLWRLTATVILIVVSMTAAMAAYSTLPAVRERMDALIINHGERSRPIMWRGAWRIFQEHPGFGGGAGAYNVLFEKHRPEAFQDNPHWAHNDYLNTLCDYGVIGFGLFFGVGGLMACRCLRGKPPAGQPRRRGFDHSLITQGLAVGGLAFALHLLVDFHLKIPAIAMTFGIIAALLVQRTWPISADPVSPTRLDRTVTLAATAIVLIMTMRFVVPHYRSEGLSYAMEREIDRLVRHPIEKDAERALLMRAFRAYGQATTLDPTNAQAWADRAHVTLLWTRHEPAQTTALAREAEGYARRALALSGEVSEFWLRLGVSLDLQGRWVAAGDAFTEAQRLAPYTSAAWYYLAWHMSRDPTYLLIAKAAVATSLRLDPGNLEAEALRQRLADSR